MAVPRNLLPTVLWAARIGSLASLALIVAFAIPEPGVPAPSQNELMGLMLFPVGILVGMGIGWWKELWGGGLATLSLLLFYAWHWMSSGDLPSGPYFVLFTFPGMLFLAVGLIRRMTGEASVKAEKTKQA